MRITLLFIFSCFLSLHASADCGTRYRDSTFGTIRHADIQYGSNYDNKNQLTNLLLDVYEPEGDTATQRPLMIFVHGGSFVGGSRTDQNINLTAAYFAQKGYVTANIEYRVEQTTLISPYLDYADKNAWYKAMIRAYHDLKAAIRFFKKDVAENGNTYRIDTSTIILYGSSAGAITVLNTTFINDTSEMTPSFKQNVAALGGIDGNSGNPGYTSSGIKAVVSCSGAMDKVDYLNDNTDVSYIGFHNNPDLVVPYDIGCYDVAFCHLGYYYGDNRVNLKAKSLHMNAEFHPINYLGHPADQYDSAATHKMILEKTTTFLYNMLCNTATTVRNNWQVKNLDVFPNPSNGSFTIQLPVNANLSSAVVKIVDLTGTEVYHELMHINSNFDITYPLSNGTYFIEIQPATNEAISYIGKFSVIR